MKRIFLAIIICCIILSFGEVFTVHASEITHQPPNKSVIVIQSSQALPDGNYLTITVSEIPVLNKASVYQKSGNKTYTLKSSNNEILWTFTVSATFSVTSGVRSECVGVTHSYSIYNTNWKYSTGHSAYSGNKATASGTFIQKLLGVVIDTHSCTVTLSCDKNGVLS